jgi:cytoskeletal protein RodZ
LPAKHSARPLGPARIVLSAAAAVLVMLVVWVAVRAVGPAEASRQPSVVLPSMPQVPLAPTSSATPAPAPSASPSASPSRSRSRSASPSPSRTSARPSSHTPVPEKTTTKPPRAAPTTTPPPSDVFSAALSVPASWEQGYVGAVRVRNVGSGSRSWSVTVSHSGQDNLRLTGSWNARGSQSGDNLTFTGGPLAPGATITFGYQVSKSGRGNARPSGCSVVGGKCGVS